MKLYRLKTIVAILLTLFVGKNTFANKELALFDSANASYAKGSFEKAIEQYEAVAKEKLSSFELYFNLGNAYYKTNSIGLSVLNYERAKKINPDDEDLITNLKLANQKTEDKIDAAPQLFLTEWKNGIVNIFSEKGWSLFCICLFAVSLILFAIYILSYRTGLKKMGFWGGSIILIFSIILFFVAQHKYELTINSSDAIITSPTATVTGSPNEKGTKLFILHEGTKVVITEEEGEWTEIKIANGNVGWVKSDFLQKI